MSSTDEAWVTARTITVISWFVAVLGLAAAVAAVLFTVSTVVQGGEVVVPTELAASQDDRRTTVDVGVLPAGVEVVTGGGQVALSAPTSTAVERLLAAGAAGAQGLAAGAAAWMLVPLLRSVAAGSPFRAGNATRVGGLAVALAAGGMVAPSLPGIAGLLVIDRLGLGDAGGPLVPSLSVGLEPMLLVAFVLVLAEAFRRGEQIGRDVEGLV